MELETRYFGKIQQEEENFYTFPSGLFGFEEETRFALLAFAESDGSMLCLQSVKTPTLAFVVMNPFQFVPEYAPQLQAQELRLLGVKQSTELCYYVLCALKRPVSDSTVNLKCPLALNDRTRRGMQVILEAGDYSMRQPLQPSRRKDG